MLLGMRCLSPVGSATCADSSLACVRASMSIALYVPHETKAPM